MKIHVTSCQAINEKGRTINICPFCENIMTFSVPQLRCKLGARLNTHTASVINFIPSDCPLREERTYVALMDKQN